MKLNNEDLRFKSIGSISPAGIGVRVTVKGWMSHDVVSYSFKIHGRAIPLSRNIIKAYICNHLQDREEIMGIRPTVTPNADPS